ncbi:MAG: adenosylcobinamide-GDP ribazoletransferase [Synergistaceae bacterium]|nr:adenosylcobinamide-GDP ribazoletransferase [Synergistaceae bacterium]
MSDLRGETPKASSVIHSLLIVFSFISIFPIPKRFLPEWNTSNLRFFSVCLPLAGIIFAFSWLIVFYILSDLTKISDLFRGFIFTFSSLSFTGGLHMDGLMDTCDAIFSHKNRETKIKILSDTHSGSFAVMGCVIILMFKTFLSAEIISHGIKLNFVLIPIFSRLGMGILLNTLKFAKNNGLAVILGSSGNSRDNYIFALMFVILSLLSFDLIPIFFMIILLTWAKICVKIFGGITGDLLGAFVEISEIFMLIGAVIEICI